MQVNRAYRVELDTTNEQALLMKKHADAARFAYNFGLARKRNVMELNQLPIEHIKIPTAMDLNKELVRLKKTTHPWLYDVSKCAPQEALRDLDVAFKNFWTRRNNGVGFPQFKSKRDSKKSFRLAGNSPTTPKMIEVTGRKVKLPFLGWLKLKHGDAHYIPAGLKINSATITRIADRWFLALNVVGKIEIPKPVIGPIVGIDRGIAKDNFMIVSDGKTELVIKSPRPLRKLEHKLKKAQRSVSRKQKGSGKREKAIKHLQRVHFKIANVRKDFINKTTTWLARNTSVVVVEDLSVKTMMGNHRVAKSFADASHGEVVRQLNYKTTWNGSKLVKIDPSYTSQDCSNCGRRHSEMKLLSVKMMNCECGTVLDRDVNASRTVRKRFLQSSEVIGRLKTPVESGVPLTSLSTQPLVDAGIEFSWL